MNEGGMEAKGITIQQCRQLRGCIREATGTTGLLSESDYQMILGVIARATDRYMRDNGVMLPLN